MTISDDWVTAAMSDDTLVVDLLVRLQGDSSPPSRKSPAPLEWSVRQRRFRSLKQAQRAIPSTPLSWSGATSFSESGGGGYEQDSSAKPPENEKLSTAARYKINGESEKRSSKRPKRKKTLSELKVEESSLLKERRHLKKEITKLRLHLEKQTAKNDKFKRMKIELQQLAMNKESSCNNSKKLQQKSTSASDEPLSLSKFILPDLNIPFEEQSHCLELVSVIS